MNTTQPSKKSGGKGVIAIVAILIVAVIVVVGVFGLRNGGFLRNIGSGSGSKVRSMTEYAKQLEKEGNTEAAAAVYALIAKGSGGELVPKAHEEIDIVKSADEIEQLNELFRHVKGGGNK